MADIIPPASRYEPFDIINAFLARQDRHALQEEKAAQNLEAAPIYNQLEIAKLEAAKRLGVQYLPQELEIRDVINARESQRAEQRGMRERTHSADEQIRANEHQLTRGSELSEGRAIRQGEREHGYRVGDEQRAEQRDIRKSEREQGEAIDRAWTAEDIRRRGAEFDEPFKDRQTERTLKLQEKLIDARGTEAQELARLRGEETRRTQAENWLNKGKFYDTHPEMVPGIRSGKVTMIEDGIVGIKPEDVVTMSNAKRETDKYEYLGAGQDAKGNLVEKFRLKKPAAKGDYIPSPSSGRSAAPVQGNTPAERWNNMPVPSAETPKGEGPAPQSTPKGDKSGDRIKKGEIEWRSMAEQSPHAALFDRVGSRYDLSPDLLASMMSQESGGRNSATSPAGAEGTMQFMPATAARFNVDSRDPTSSVVGAAKYINKMLGMYDDNIGLALAGYNWGEGGPRSDRGVHAWLRSGADPRRMPAETKNYVQSITGKPIEFWLDKYFNDREGVSQVPKTRPSGMKNAQGDDLFYVDVG